MHHHPVGLPWGIIDQIQADYCQDVKKAGLAKLLCCGSDILVSDEGGLCAEDVRAVK